MRDSLVATALTNADLEAQVLRALADAGQEKFFELIDLLPPAAFPTHQSGYRALADAFAADKPAPDGLPEAELPAGFDLEAAARELAELARKRLVAEAMERAWAGILSKPAAAVIAELQEAVAAAEAAVKELSAGGLVFAADQAGEVLARVRETRKAVEKTGRPVVYPATGLPAADRLLSGFAPGLWVLIGSPTVGKTFFALHLTVQFLRQLDAAALWVNFEEPTWRLILKAWCNLAGLDWSEYTAGRGDLAALEKAAVDFASLGARMAVIEASENITCAHIRAKAAAVKAKSKAKHLLVVVDYLQLLANTPAGNAGDRAYDAMRHRVGAVVAGLREVANRLEATVLVISAANRASYDKPETLAAARESSDIEYSADVFLRLQGTANPNELELHVLKNRVTGQGGVVPLVRLSKQSRFGEKDKTAI